MNNDDKIVDKFLVNGITQVAYLCDRLACSDCSGDDCHHTTDINHAVNFRSINGLFIEKSEYDNIDYSDPSTTNKELLLGDTYNQQAFTIGQYSCLNKTEE